MEQNLKIYVAGHKGLAGSAIVNCLKNNGYTNLVTRSHRELELTCQREVEEFFSSEKPDIVFLAAAKVGGIQSNRSLPAEFIYQNIAIQTNVIHAAWKSGVQRLIFLGSSCMYPRNCNQPMKEEYLLTGLLEPTNKPYAIAKLAGMEMCRSYYKQYGCEFFSVIPANLYGPNDNYDLDHSHVIPALIRKFHESKLKNVDEIEAWGTGEILREFLYSEDMADACIFLMNLPREILMSKILSLDSGAVNIASSEEVNVKQLASTVQEITGFRGKVVWDSSKPDGMPRKLLDGSILTELAWQPKVHLKEGLQLAYEDFLSR
jgi:GDP-L-fucose synthase